MKGESVIAKRDDIVISERGIICGETALLRSRGGRGGAVAEISRGPAYIVTRRSRLSVFLPRGRLSGIKKPVLSRSVNSAEAFGLSGDFAGMYCAGNGAADEKSVRVIERSLPLAASFCMFRGYFTALLFLPLAAVTLSGICGTGIISDKRTLYAAALTVLLPVVRVFAAAEKNAYIHYARSGGMVRIARGAVSRRILCFPASAADADIRFELPLPAVRVRPARVLCVGGAGMVPVPAGITADVPESRAIMRLERHSPETSGWGGAVLTAACALFAAFRFVLTNWDLRYYAAALLVPAAALLLRYSMAQGRLGDRPAALLYRDDLVVSGIQRGCVVRVRIGRGNIARAEISQSILQRQRGLCTLTVSAAGNMKPVACRDVDYLRARALAERLYRG